MTEQKRQRCNVFPNGKGFVLAATMLGWFSSPAVGETPNVQPLVEGRKVDAEAYPWMAALSLKQPDGSPGAGNLFCGGILIHPIWVLTAAHCVDAYWPDELQVSFHGDDPDAAPRSIKEIIIQPGYRFRNGQIDADLALLRLVQPARLPETALWVENDEVLPHAREGRALGWRIQNGSPVLEELDLPILERNAPELADEGLLLDAIPVGSGSGEAGVCYGDSGGPLLLLHHGAWEVAGVASYIIGECGDFAVYTNLQPYRQWIQGHAIPDFQAWAESHAVTALSHDDDNDGSTNFLEFALGSDPRDTQSHATIELLANASTPRAPLLRFSQRAGVNYTLAISPNLIQWAEEADPEILMQTPVEAPYTQVTLRGKSALEDHAGMHYRVMLRPSPHPVSAGRAVGREFYMRADSSVSVDGESRRMDVRYLVDGLADGMTTFVLEAQRFRPTLTIIDLETETEVLHSAAGADRRVETDLQTRSTTPYQIILSSVDVDPQGPFTFHFPRLPGSPAILELGRQPVLSRLDESSDFDGNYYWTAYQLFGATAGDTVRLTLSSDPSSGGFTPFLEVRDNLGTTVTATAGEPAISTSVTFTLEAGRSYFVFASTFFPNQTGPFTLYGVRLED